MYYYLGMERADDRVTSEELVPVILRDGIVVAWGWEDLERLAGSRPEPGTQTPPAED